MASLHCYCFYVYAARLVEFLISPSVLRSFWIWLWYCNVQAFRCHFTRAEINSSNVWRTKVESSKNKNWFGWFYVGPTLRWHVHFHEPLTTTTDHFCLLCGLSSGNLLQIGCSLNRHWIYALIYPFVFKLRLAVLLLQGTLKRVIWLINSLPIYSVILWILSSPLIAGKLRWIYRWLSVRLHTIARIQGDVRLEPIADRESTLKLIWIKLPVLLSLKRTLNPSSPEYPNIDWGRRLNQIVSGDLIYPL